MPFLPTTIKSRGYYFTSQANGRWFARGRGLRREVSVEELQALLNPPPRKRKAQP